MALNRTAALESASWGLGQVLGSNFKSAGFTDVEDMVEKMVESERHQLLGMFNFIASNKLGQFLKDHDWLNFALKYNGPNAEKEGYPLKVEKAFDAFVATSPPDIEARIAQLGLTFLEISPGGVDGVFGKNSRRAMQRFQATEGLPTTDDLNDNVLDAIVKKVWGSL